MSITAKLRKLRRATLIEKLNGERTSREILYAHMLSEALRISKISYAPFFAIGGAANYSLLYLIYRIQTELQPAATLELGIGQSTLLLDALGAKGMSIEHDAAWAAHMQTRVKREILTKPLERRTYRGVTTDSYTYDGDQTFEFAIIDGPQGRVRNSRWGALEILERTLADDFIVIFDDAARKGEQDTAVEFQAMRGGDVHIVRGGSSQCLIFSERFFPAAWY